MNQTAEVGRIPRGSLSGSARIVNAYGKVSENKTDFLPLQLTFGIGHQDVCMQPSVYMFWFRVLCLNAENAPQRRQHLKMAAQIRAELDLDQSEAPLLLRLR